MSKLDDLAEAIEGSKIMEYESQAAKVGITIHDQIAELNASLEKTLAIGVQIVGDVPSDEHTPRDPADIILVTIECALGRAVNMARMIADQLERIERRLGRG